MYVIVSTYRAKVGEEDAIIALHEGWQRNHDLKARNCLSWQLLRNLQAPREFIAIAQFEDKEAAQAASNNLSEDSWDSRLLSLTEGDTIEKDYITIWQLR